MAFHFESTAHFFLLKACCWNHRGELWSCVLHQPINHRFINPWWIEKLRTSKYDDVFVWCHPHWSGFGEGPNVFHKLWHPNQNNQTKTSKFPRCKHVIKRIIKHLNIMKHIMKLLIKKWQKPWIISCTWTKRSLRPPSAAVRPELMGNFQRDFAHEIWGLQMFTGNHHDISPIGSMVLLYMVTWIPSIYPQC